MPWVNNALNWGHAWHALDWGALCWEHAGQAQRKMLCSERATHASEDIAAGACWAQSRIAQAAGGCDSPPKAKQSASPTANMRGWDLVPAVPSRLCTAASVSSPGPAAARTGRAQGFRVQGSGFRAQHIGGGERSAGSQTEAACPVQTLNPWTLDPPRACPHHQHPVRPRLACWGGWAGHPSERWGRCAAWAASRRPAGARAR